MTKNITITANWDAKEKLWYATSKDITGLHVCCPTLDEVIEVVDDVLTDLVAHNLKEEVPISIPYHLMHEHIIRTIQ